VVRVDPIELADVQRQAGVVGHGHKELLDQLGVIAADLLGRDLQSIAQVGPAAAVQRHLHQRLIEGCHEMPKAVNAAAIAQGLGQGLPHGDAHVLVGVVIIDVGVADSADFQVQQPMAGELVQHVIEKRHARTHLAAPRAVEIEHNAHVGLTGDAMNFTCAHGFGRRSGACSELL